MKIIGLFLSYSLVVVAFVVLTTKFFYPHHRSVAIGIYVLSWIFFMWALWAKKQYFLEHAEVAGRFLYGYGWYVLLACVLVAFVYCALVLVPPKKSHLRTVSSAQLAQYIGDDERTFLYINDSLEEQVRYIENDLLFRQNVTELSLEKRTHLKKTWKVFFDTLLEIDLLKERYKDFYVIDPIAQGDNHRASFLLAYNALLAQNHYAFRVLRVFDDRDDIQKVLNDKDVPLGLSRNTYTQIASQLSHPHEILRINAGRSYSALIVAEMDESPLYEVAQSRIAFMDQNFTSYSKAVLSQPLKNIENSAFQAWFPLQKSTALNLSYVRTTDRAYLISPEFAADKRAALEPGDVMLERREWHATNIGIPGYWTHSAFYIGTLQDINAFFGDLDSLGGVLPSAVIAQKFPDAYKTLSSTLEDGYAMSVIEVKRPGVIFQSFEHSANADALGVIRPRISKQEKWLSVLESLRYYGRQYDYNFDFVTDNALVCSELIYKAYQDIASVQIVPREMNGRLIFSPNHFVEKFDEEFDRATQDFDFVLFWDGNEKTGEVVESGARELRESWKRPKWHILNDHLE